MKKVIIYSTIFVFSIVLFGCEKIFDNNDDENDSEIKEADEYISLSDDELSSVSHFDTTGRISFTRTDGNINSLERGSIIASEPTDYAEDGFLKKVEEIQTYDDSVVIVTTDANFEEVFEEASFSFTKDLTIDDVENPVFKKGVRMVNNKASQDGNFYFEIEHKLYENGPASLSLNGYLEMDPSVEFSFDIDNHTLEELRFVAGIEENSDLSLEAMGTFELVEEEYSLARMPMGTITTFVGLVPVVIRPVLELTVGADGDVNLGLTTGITQTANLQGGFAYEGGNWSEISESDISFGYNPPELEAGFEMRGYVGPQLNLLLYGLAGPYTDLNGYLQVNADLMATPWWELIGGVELDAGLTVRFLGNTITDYDPPGIIIGYYETLAEADGAATGFLEGTVKNAITQEGLSNVDISIYNENENLVTSGQTESDGSYYLEVSNGIGYHILFEKDGFIAVDYEEVTIPANQTKVLEPVMQIDDNYSGLGSIQGTISDALTGDGVDDVMIEVREGINNTTGSVLANSYTNQSGNYEIGGLEAGNYTIAASKSNYNSVNFSVYVIGGETTSNQNGTITPILDENEVRFVLSWGEYPTDLDSHLTGPMEDSDERLHVFYHNSDYYYNSELYVNLDRDDTDSYGPETITIYNQTDGTYRYSVHDYSNRYANYSMELANSEAYIKVFKGNELIESFFVPNQEGTLWTVCEVIGNSVNPINEVTYESNPGDVTRKGNKTDAEHMRNLPNKR